MAQLNRQNLIEGFFWFEPVQDENFVSLLLTYIITIMQTNIRLNCF